MPQHQNNIIQKTLLDDDDDYIINGRKYKIKSIISKSGGQYEGHYVAYCRKSEGTWDVFDDDEELQTIDHESVKLHAQYHESGQPYIYFFETDEIKAIQIEPENKMDVDGDNDQDEDSNGVEEKFEIEVTVPLPHSLNYSNINDNNNEIDIPPSINENENENENENRTRTRTRTRMRNENEIKIRMRTKPKSTKKLRRKSSKRRAPQRKGSMPNWLKAKIAKKADSIVIRKRQNGQKVVLREIYKEVNDSVQAKYGTNYVLKDAYAIGKMRINGHKAYKAAKKDGKRLNGRGGDYPEIEQEVVPKWKNHVKQHGKKPNRTQIREWAEEANKQSDIDDLLYSQFKSSDGWITKMLLRYKLQAWYDINITKIRKRLKKKN